jgi:8-oxo-dGTP diphosphatase
VDSRAIPAADRLPGLPDHQNAGIFYQVRITGGQLRPEPNGEIAESVWTLIPDVVCLRRSGRSGTARSARASLLAGLV